MFDFDYLAHDLGLNLIVLINMISAWYLFGLIWLVQLSIYPHLLLLCQHCPEQWPSIHHQHSAVMGAFAGAPMIIQLTAAIGLAVIDPNWFTGTYLTLVVLTWILTFGLSVPCHNRLSSSADLPTAHKLVTSNWYRTIVWTIIAGMSFVL